MADLTPDELDRLEDALDEITGPDRITDLEGLDLSPALVEHAAAYVEVLDTVEPHLASVAPSEGVLDDVIAKAQAEVEIAAPPPSAAGDGASSTRRAGWRRWWLPAVSLGGVCAGVFFLVTPEAALEDQADRVPVAAPESSTVLAREIEEAEEAEAEVPPTAAPSPAADSLASPASGSGRSKSDAVEGLRTKGYGGLGVSLKETAGGASGPAPAADRRPSGAKRELEGASEPMVPPSGQAAPVEADPSSEPEGSATKTAPSRARKKSSKSKSAAPSSNAMPAMDLDADPKVAWFEALAEAHAQVRSGACSRALDSYAELLRSEQSGEVSRRELARIQGGMGVCYERRGQLKMAQSAFARARELDAGVEAWIDDLRASTKQAP